MSEGSGNNYMMDRGDVSIEGTFKQCDCDDLVVADHSVLLDFRNAGIKTVVYEGCYSCCEEFAARLRYSLPPEDTNAASR